ncbi:MAG: hypothetical protein ACO3JL_17555, partial [Myxococcota bacterium]
MRLSATSDERGSVWGLDSPHVLNRRDFAYALAFTPDAQRLAYVHHVTVDMELSVEHISVENDRWKRAINHHQYDGEDVAFLPPRVAGATTVVVPSRQGIARRFSTADDEVATFAYGAPLTRVAVSPSGSLVALGGADGRVLLLDAERWAFVGEAHVHEDEVQGLRFLSDDRLLSVSFDGTARETGLVRGAPKRFSAHTTRLDDGARAFLVHLDGQRAVTAVRDVRQPTTVISSAAVARLGLSPLLEAPPATVLTPLGPEPRPVVDMGELHLRYLRLGPMQAAVCDECVPRGAELVLGAPLLQHASFGDDLARSMLLVSMNERAEGQGSNDGASPAVAGWIAGAVSLVEGRRVILPGPGCDLDVSPITGQAVVAYSHARAIRTPDLYAQEKRGTFPPRSAASGSILLDLETFELGRRYIGHEGFTVTAALSPDGKTIATGGWDRRLVVFDVA